MPRNMSFSLTTDQIRARTKTVTRRFGWRTLQPGTVVWAVEKAMGLKKGESVVRICPIRIVSNRAEPLYRMLDDPAYGAAEARREGFPHLDGRGFVDFLLRSVGGTVAAAPQRIEFAYVERTDPDWPGPTSHRP